MDTIRYFSISSGLDFYNNLINNFYKKVLIKNNQLRNEYKRRGRYFGKKPQHCLGFFQLCQTFTSFCPTTFNLKKANKRKIMTKSEKKVKKFLFIPLYILSFIFYNIFLSKIMSFCHDWSKNGFL